MNALRLAPIMLLALPGFAYGQGQEDPYSRLAFFEGTWTVEGQEPTYRETCSWFENHRFLVCKTEDKEAGTPTWSMSILGYSAERQAYTHTFLGSSGSIRTIHGWHDGNVWTFIDEVEQGSSTRRTQITITPTEKGFTFRQDVSTNGAAWKMAAEFTYVRLP